MDSIYFSKIPLREVEAGDFVLLSFGRARFVFAGKAE